MKKTIAGIMITFWMGATPALAAGDQEHMHGHDQQKMEQPVNQDNHKAHGSNMGQHAMPKNKMAGMFLVKKEIDGYAVSFHAMKAKSGKEMGGSHNFMIKVEKDGVAVTGLTANSKVVHPNGKSESKMMMKMGDWHMAGYDLGHEGRHQLMALFKTADGAKHFGGVYYPEADKSGK